MAPLKAGEGKSNSDSDSVWSAAADKMVATGGAGENFIKEGLTKVEAKASALKVKEDVEKLRSKETMSRASSATRFT